MAEAGGTHLDKAGTADLRASRAGLTRLADDLDDMRDHLDAQVRRMDELVDAVERGWQGPAARTYRGFHRAVAEDAVRIRGVLHLLGQAVRMSRDGFTEQELDVLDRMRAIRVDIDSEVDRLSTSAVPDPPVRPRSGLDSF
ncbi:WXG100 family type VII secretion target [Streptomyces uncialis]|uniref:WXG100 family type VII secretion target n=1 Tax=Streptomyces uncialis TaxID=1048205 RepID=UPI0033EFA68A